MPCGGGGCIPSVRGFVRTGNWRWTRIAVTITVPGTNAATCARTFEFSRARQSLAYLELPGIYVRTAFGSKARGVRMCVTAPCEGQVSGSRTEPHLGRIPKSRTEQLSRLTSGWGDRSQPRRRGIRSTSVKELGADSVRQSAGHWVRQSAGRCDRQRAGCIRIQ